MFEHLSEFSKILVTGPQRAGTTICAKMIATDTGLRFLPEGAMATGSKADEVHDALRRLVERFSGVVVQCPIQCRYIHRFSADDTLIVMMMRPIDDIAASEKRIGWGDGFQRILYRDVIAEYDVHRLPIAAVKYAYWEQYQRDRVLHYLEQSYDALHEHPLWVPKYERSGFGPRQIDADNTFRKEIEIRPQV